MENRDWLIICGPLAQSSVSYHLVKGPIAMGALAQRVESLISQESTRFKKYHSSMRYYNDPQGWDDSPLPSFPKISVAFSSVFRVVIVGCQSWMKTVDKEIFQSEDFNCG